MLVSNTYGRIKMLQLHHVQQTPLRNDLELTHHCLDKEIIVR